MTTNISKIILSYLFKTNLAAFRAAILANNTNRICRILDIERNNLSKELDGEGNTALIFAIQHASPLTVELLLNQGAQPDQPHFTTFHTPLSFLAARPYHDDDSHTHSAKNALHIATLLLDRDAYVDKPSPFTYIDDAGKQYDVKETPLMTAVRTRNLALASLLIDRKANVNYIEKQSQQRPVHVAVLNGDEAMFDLLEGAGASCRSVVTDGNNTLLHCFCSVKANDERRSLLLKLVELGCDVNAENDQQRTALMLAAKMNMVKTCEMLLSLRAETEGVDFRGQRAIDLAELGSECFRLLLHTDQLQRQKSRSHQHVDRLIYKKTVLPRRQLSLRVAERSEHPALNGNKLKRYSSDIISSGKPAEGRISFISNDPVHEKDAATKSKRKSGRLRQIKQKLRPTRHLSLQSLNHLF